MLSCYCANTGSTGGGIKMFRTLVLFRQAGRELMLLVHPQAVRRSRSAGQVVPNQIVFAVLAFVVLYFGTVVVLTFALLASGLDFISAFSAIIACINNAGPGLGVVGPASNYQGAHRLPDLGLLAGDAARPPRDLQRAGAVHADVLAQVMAAGKAHGEDPAARCSAASCCWRCCCCSSPIVVVAVLDHRVTQQFEGRRWTLPARVYAQPIELYVGQSLSAEAVRRGTRAARLPRAGARLTGRARTAAGDRVDVYRARVPLLRRDAGRAQRCDIGFAGDAIASLRDAKGADVPVIRLDPLLIGSIFPIHGEDRIIVSPAEVPPLLPEALKAVEDRKFDTHHGVNPLAILRAVFVNVRAGPGRAGRQHADPAAGEELFPRQPAHARAQGRGSGDGRHSRESRFEKADIMNAYINEIYLGQDGHARGPRLRAREPVLLRQAAGGTRPARNRADGGDRARAVVLRPAAPRRSRARTPQPRAARAGRAGRREARGSRARRDEARSASPTAPDRRARSSSRPSSTSCGASCARTTRRRT